MNTVPGVLSATWEARVGGPVGRRCSPFTARNRPNSRLPRATEAEALGQSVVAAGFLNHPFIIVHTDCLLSGLVLDTMTMGLGSAASRNQRDRVTSVSNRKKTRAFPCERWPAAPRGHARELSPRGSAGLGRRPRPRGPRADRVLSERPAGVLSRPERRCFVLLSIQPLCPGPFLPG